MDRANELKYDKKARRAVKRVLWLLLKNQESLIKGPEIKLKELLIANKTLSIVYLMKQALKDIWFCSSLKEAFRNWKSWYKKVEEAEMPALKQIARKLRLYERGIIA